MDASRDNTDVLEGLGDILHEADRAADEEVGIRILAEVADVGGRNTAGSIVVNAEMVGLTRLGEEKPLAALGMPLIAASTSFLSG